MILDPLFIFGAGPIPALGVAGAAMATVISQWFGALWGLQAVFFRLGFPRHLRLADAWRLLVVGRDLFLRLAGVVLLLISIPVVLGGEWGGSILRFLSCIGIAFAYFVLNTMTLELGARNVLAPSLAAALPLLVTGGLGLVLIWRSR